jgi:NitT/TauT family transport system ATP-binding protein
MSSGVTLDQTIRQRAKELLASTGLEGFEKHWPWQLSGGMRQRVAICRTLLTEPELLLLDEPFGALDALTRLKMNALLQRLWLASEAAVVFVTHSATEAVLLSDRILVLSERPGRIIDEIDVPLPRPRSQKTMTRRDFLECEAKILQHFEME